MSLQTFLNDLDKLNNRTSYEWHDLENKYGLSDVHKINELNETQIKRHNEACKKHNVKYVNGTIVEL